MATIGSEFNRAVRLHRAGRLQPARLLYQRVLERNPRHGEAHHRMGLLLASSGRTDLAVGLIAKAIEFNGPRPAYCTSLGRILLSKGDAQAAIACFRQALKAEPFNTSTYFDLSRALTQCNDFATAALALEQVVDLEPANEEAWCELGNALYRQAKRDEAARCYQKALALQPQFAEAAYNLGVVFLDSDRLDEAKEMFESAIRLRSGYALAHNNLGNVMYQMAQPEIAVEHYNAALKSDPSFPRAHLNLGIALLSLGEYGRGFEQYEWRFGQLNGDRRHAGLPLWDGSPLKGKRILLHSDQGLGDVIQFVRYTRLVQESGGAITLECPKPLVRLLESFCKIESVIEVGGHASNLDCQAPLASLPFLFGTHLATIPAEAPYIVAPTALVDDWAVSAQGFRIGLTWKGNPSHPNDRNRSIPHDLLQPLTSCKGTVVISLQKPPDTRLTGAIHLGAALGDFADTAAVVSQMDLVISVDTAVAHLAGALGKPVWLLLPFAADWRWMWDRADSPWYPTMRLFRQPRRGDWTGVISEVRKQLDELVGA